MSFHVPMWFANVTNDVDTDLTPVNDQILAIQNSHFFPVRDFQLIFAAAVSANLDRAKLISPTLRQVTNPYIRPINVGADFPNQPNVADYRHQPFQLSRLEELEVEVHQDGVAAEDVFVTAGLMESFEPLPAGEVQ